MLDTKQFVKQKWNARNKKYYVNLGYKYTKIGDEFLVRIKDLTPSSTAIVKIVCDYCGNDFYVPYNRLKLYADTSVGHACGNCKHLKVKDTNMKKYGVENVSQLKEVVDKRKNTCLYRYGETSNLKTDECKDRIRQTCLKKYGVDSYLKTSDCIQNRIQSNMKKYGVDNAFKSKDVQNHIKNTILNRYGVENVSQCPAIHKRALESFCRNGTIKSSKQQDAVGLMLRDMYGNCEMNKIIDYYVADCFVKVNNIYIDVEYDGWYWHKGHESSDRKRDGYMYSKGYKVIRIKGGVDVPTELQIKESVDFILQGNKYAEIVLDWQD